MQPRTVRVCCIFARYAFPDDFWAREPQTNLTVIQCTHLQMPPLTAATFLTKPHAKASTCKSTNTIPNLASCVDLDQPFSSTTLVLHSMHGAKSPAKECGDVLISRVTGIGACGPSERKLAQTCNGRRTVMPAPL